MSQVAITSGPAEDQIPLPALLTKINDLDITIVGAPGPVFVIGHALFALGALAETLTLQIRRNNQTLPVTGSARRQVAVAGQYEDLTAFNIAEAVPGDVFSLYASADFNTAGVPAFCANLAIIGLPPSHALAPQA